MSDNLWQKIEDIFPLVVDLPTGEREAYLNTACDGDETLRREILSLVEADKNAAELYEKPAILPTSLSNAFSLAQTEISHSLSLIGRQIGAYRIVRKIGVGGMGDIYLANRDDGAFHKEVAVKLVKNGSNTMLNLRRFRHERQVLAALEHPNIARLLDGGTTSDGLPYFVMEYVEGKQLFEFCDSRKLNLQARLQLFRQICAAVSYAHDKQIVHRDLKPGNILVNETGNVKLLDFGIAKILDPGLIHESVIQTATFMRQMTPEYASPEQIKGEKITPASDIYSLGVILYELLSGERPYKFPSRAIHDIARVVCEEEIRAPKINSTDTSPDDLQFIVLKALRKKPAERYLSVNNFDRDIERFLTGQPVLTDGARLDFFEKAASDSGGASISLAVAPFQILTTETSETTDAKNSDDFLAVGLADALATKLSGVRKLAVRPTSSVMRLAATGTDSHTMGKELSADYVLEGHVLRSGEQIRVSVQLLDIRDDSVFWAEQFDETDADIFRLQDSISERVAASLVPRLTSEEQEILRRHGTTNAAAFEAYLRGRVSYQTYTFDGIAASEKHFKQALKHDPNFALAHSGLADFYNWFSVACQVSPAEGFALAKHSAQRAIELDPSLAEAYASLAFAVWAFDWNFAKAERLFQKSIALNGNYAKAHEWYAYLLSSTARHDEAVEEMRCTEALDPNSPAVAAMYSFCLHNARRYSEGLQKIRRALELDPNYYLALQGLGWVCPPLGKFDEAIAGCRRAVEISDVWAFNKFSLAMALIAAGQTEEALKITGEIKNLSRSQHVPPYYLALIYTALGEFNKSFRWLDRAIEERGYWTLWMLVEPRFDVLRKDPRFAERLKKIKPLHSPKTTGNLDIRRTENIASHGKFKTRTAFASAAVLFCVVIIVVAANFKVVFLQKDDSSQKIVFFNKDKLPEHTSVTDAPTNERGENEKPRTADPIAEELYLAGKQQLAARTRDAIEKAIKFFTEASKRDPNFALAFSGLADAHILIAGGPPKPSLDDYRKAEQYAVKALALDPDLAEARISLGMAKFRNSKDFAQAEKHFLRAIEINSASATAHHWYSVILSEVGRFDDALHEIKIAADLDPSSAVIQVSVAELYMRSKRYDEATYYFDKALEADNKFVSAYIGKSLIQQFKGEYEAALETYRKARIYNGADENDAIWMLMESQAHAARGQRENALEVLNRFFRCPDYRKHPTAFAVDIALVYNLMNDAEKALEWLVKIKSKHPEQLHLLKNDPRFANLRSDKRFPSIT